MAISPFTSPTIFGLNFSWINPIEWGNAIRDALVEVVGKLMGMIGEYFISPLVNAVQSFITWLWNSLVGMFNSLFSAILNFIYSWIVNPLLSIFQMVLNRIREKIKGIIYISIVTPLIIKQSKGLIEEESLTGMLKKGVFILFKPILGYLASEIIYATISPYLQPVYIPPVTPPSPPSIPPIERREINIIDYVSVTDRPAISLTTYPSIFDYVAVNDVVNIELILGERRIEPADAITINDSVTVELTLREINIGVADAITVNDVVTVELL